MLLNGAISSALRAIAKLPDMPSNELERFSESVKEGLPMPDASFGADPVWRVAKGAPVRTQFVSLLSKFDGQSAIFGDGEYFGCQFEDVTIIVVRSTIRTILNNASREDLSDAEVRLAVHLLQGKTLKSAASEDGTGYETKRTQFKTLAGKLQIRGQIEVVRVLTSRVMQSLAQFAQPNHQADLDLYASAYLPAAVRRMTLTSNEGNNIPVLDYGPINGRTLVVLHPMIFPPINRSEIEHANRSGVRLLWPLRNGLLCRSAPMRSAKHHLQLSVDGLLSVIEQLIGGPTPVLALVSSGSIATRAAIRKPSLISSISFAATCYSAGREGRSLRYFGTDLAELALRSETIMARTVLAMRSYTQNESRFRSLIESVFRGSERDMSHLADEFSGPDGGSRIRSAVLNSTESMKQDFFNQTHFKWAELSNVRVPIRFLQGSDDSIHPPSDLAAMVQKMNGGSLSIADGMGHLLHREDLHRAIEFSLEHGC